MGKLFFFFMILLVSSCGMISHPVSSDYDLRGNFDEYITFKILSNNELDQSSRKILERAIDQRLSAMGYLQTNEPSLYVNYHLIKGKFEMKTFEQSDLAYHMAVRDFQPVEEVESIKIKKVNGEMLVISLYDPETSKVVWRGQSTKQNFKTYRELVFSVHIILDEYILASRQSKPVALF